MTEAAEPEATRPDPHQTMVAAAEAALKRLEENAPRMVAVASGRNREIPNDVFEETARDQVRVIAALSPHAAGTVLHIQAPAPSPPPWPQQESPRGSLVTSGQFHTAPAAPPLAGPSLVAVAAVHAASAALPVAGRSLVATAAAHAATHVPEPPADRPLTAPQYTVPLAQPARSRVTAAPFPEPYTARTLGGCR